MQSAIFSNQRSAVGNPYPIWVASFAVFCLAAAGQGEYSTQRGEELLTRGPIHEAFAIASTSETTDGFVIPAYPPDPIAELPPDMRPQGVNVAWIPGYWSWDEDRNDFIWLSGVWRNVPPNRQWIPGYWAQVNRGSQWVSGFWGEIEQNEVTYLPAPPRSLEYGPSSPAPRSRDLWTPGSWVWQRDRYAWQPGYWVQQQPDWVWCPAHYTWTPRGYVYIPGYWDHDIVHRGVMFAPVYYAQPIYRQPDYRYSPNIVIDLAAIIANLFVQPRSRHYYYGDYYDGRYEDRGIYPWHSTRHQQYGADPIYLQFRWAQLQRDPQWDLHVDEQFQYRRQHVHARPPQTFALQIERTNTLKTDIPEHIFIGRSLAETAQSRRQPLIFAPVDMDERRRIATRGRDVHRLQSERAKMEAPPADSGRVKRTREATQPVKIQLPESPVTARRTDTAGQVKTPPPVPAAPRPQAVDERSGPQQKPIIVDKRRNVHARPDRTTVPRRPQRHESPQTTRRKTEATRPEPVATAPSVPQADQQATVDGTSDSRKPRTAQTPRRQKQAVQPQTRSSARPQSQAEPETPTPDRKPSKPEPSETEVKSEKKEPKPKVSRSGTRVQSKKDSGRSNESEKKKKGGDR